MLLSGAIGLVLAIVATVCAGAGHGTYVPAKICFPYTMLLTMVDGRISNRLIALALIQFPVYGLLIGSVILRKNWVWFVIGTLLLVHLVAVWFCFSVGLSGF